jgi:hypothetical protein
MNWRNLSAHCFRIAGVHLERTSLLEFNSDNSMIMPYASNGAKNYFKVTNRQYDVLLIDPRGVIPFENPH